MKYKKINNVDELIKALENNSAVEVRGFSDLVWMKFTREDRNYEICQVEHVFKTAQWREVIEQKEQRPYSQFIYLKTIGEVINAMVNGKTIEKKLIEGTQVLFADWKEWDYKGSSLVMPESSQYLSLDWLIKTFKESIQSFKYRIRKETSKMYWFACRYENEHEWFIEKRETTSQGMADRMIKLWHKDRPENTGLFMQFLGVDNEA